MNDVLTLSQYRLTIFLACQRRFQLHYLDRIPWPLSPGSERAEKSIELGQRFHQLLERHFLGLSIATDSLVDPGLRHWWSRFQGSGLELPRGRRLPEIGLTMPVGKHQIMGRFDLLILGTKDENAFAHLFDWKSGKAQSESELRHAWQTRLYLALLVEGGAVLRVDGRPLNPDQVAVTYWYVDEPDAPRTIRYDDAWHAQNWAEIRELIRQIDERLGDETWPLTDDWSTCCQCAYQSLCGRQGAHPLTSESIDEEPSTRASLQLEPELP